MFKCSNFHFLYKSWDKSAVQHLSCILAFTMNVFITLTLLAAAASACPELLPAKCGPEEMMCPGGMDPQSGCPLPDLCVPGIWARQDSCPSFCPTFCGPDEMMCPGGMADEGCPMPDMCMPSKGNSEIQNQEKLIMTSSHLKL